MGGVGGGYFSDGELAAMLMTPSVTVVDAHAKQAVVVEVRQLPRSTRDGFVCLADIWRLARLPGSLRELAFDFVGADGFRVSKRCGARLGGVALVKGFVDRATRNLVWEESLDLPCFFSVKALAKIIAEPCAAESPVLPHVATEKGRGGCQCGHARKKESRTHERGEPRALVKSG